MEVDPALLSARDSYRLMIACVIPRPIGWASTLAADGTPNLAPFSYFGGVAATPMTVMLSVGRRNGVRKDTASNLLATREAVIHIPHHALGEAMVATSAEAAPEVDEFALAGLTPVPSTRVRPPRIREAAIAMEAVLTQHLEVGASPMDLFLLEIVHLHLDDAFVVDGLPDAGRLRALGRLGGAAYCDTAAPFEIPRP
ncbi:MAG: flavin reductase family protein [Planctomycetota bacterium]|nr:flavin reductase family protein [Planctomycetota bacterium]